MPHGGYKAVRLRQGHVSTYSFEEYTQVKHVMYDNTAVARKDWHRTIFGDRLRDDRAGHAHRPKGHHAHGAVRARPPSPAQRPPSAQPPQRPGGLTRRSLLRASAARRARGLAGLAALSGCGIPAPPASQGGGSADDHSDKEKVVNFSNWPEYIDVDDKTASATRRWTRSRKQTGIKVNYTEDINDNDEFFGKIQPQLAAGQDTGRDLIVLTDWMAARLIRLG